jgi:hypothetical protein
LPGNSNELSVYASEAYYSGPDSRLRRFAYRVDGFVSARSDTEGELMTKPLVFSGDQLVINYAADQGGSVRVELLSEDGNPLDGYSLSDATPASGDSIRHVVSWTKTSRVSEMSKQPLRIRFILRSADLYSFQFASLRQTDKK